MAIAWNGRLTAVAAGSAAFLAAASVLLVDVLIL